MHQQLALPHIQSRSMRGSRHIEIDIESQRRQVVFKI